MRHGEIDSRTKHTAALQEMLFTDDVINSLPGLFYLINSDTHPVRWNLRLEELTGYSGKEIAAMSATDFVDGEDRQLIADRMRQAFAEGEAFAEADLIGKDGIKVSRFHFSGRRITIGGDLYLVGLGIDISARVVAEEALKISEMQLRESEKRFRYILEHAPVGMDIATPDGCILQVNHALCEMLGYRKDELENLNIRDITHPDDIAASLAELQKLLSGEHQSYMMEKRYLRKDGRVVWGHITVSLHADGGEPYFISQIEDVTESKQAAENIHLMAKIFEHSSEAFLITDENNCIVNVNSSFTQLTGYDKVEVIGQNPRILSSGAQSGKFYSRMWHSIRQDGHWEGEIWDRRKDGSTYPKWLNISTVRNAQGDIVNYIGSFSDISERKRAENEIRQLAYHDTLTGLHNRFSLTSQLEQALSRARRNRNRIALIFIDLDRFKIINDTLGHQIGDQLLIQVAQRISNSVRESDLVARLGGDEFVVMLTDVLHNDEAAVVAGKIIDQVSQPYDVDGHCLYTAPSIGISMYPEDGGSVNLLMQNADTAMYRAKNNGGGSFHFFESLMNNEALERLSLENSLRQALQREEFELFYQPLINLAGKATGVEALIRWNHPEMGLVYPDRFIPIAEETGLILAIGQWVIRTACHQLRQWMDMGLPLIRMAVNLSSLELLQDDFVATVNAIIQESGIRPEQLELEITERVAMVNPEKTIVIMNALKAAHIRLSIDDFGTGYSSLSYLKLFPIDQVKIDRSFIRDLEIDPNDVAITTATIVLARKLGLEVVAEGVESKQQSDILNSHGCHLKQGYYFSRPVPAEELLNFIY